MKFAFNDYLKIYYRVSYDDKDKAKKYRLKWNPNNKLWFSEHQFYNDGEEVETDGICALFDIVDYEMSRDYDDNIKNLLISQVKQHYDKLKYNIEHKEEIEEKEMKKSLERLKKRYPDNCWN